MRFVIDFDVSYHKQVFLKLTNCHKENVLRSQFCLVKIVAGGYLFIRLSNYPKGCAMKMNVCGVQRIAGTSKAGSAFDMCQLLALVPIEAANGKVNISGTGYKVMEVTLDAEALPQFMHVKFPATLELTTDVRAERGELKTVITGIAAAPAKAAA